MKKILAILIPIILVVGVLSGAAIVFITTPPKSEVTLLKSLEEAFYVELLAVSEEEKEEITGYEFQYSLSSEFEEDASTFVKTAETSATVEELKPEAEYFVRVRTYRENGKRTRYSRWSEAKSVVTKRKIPLERIDVTPTEAELLVEKTLQLEVTLVPQNTSFKKIRYVSSDESVATVDQNGLVTGIAEGDVQITVESLETDKKTTVNIRVKLPFVATTGIKITNAEGITLDMSTTLQIKAEVIPANATNKQIYYSVSDDSKAKIDENGVVTGLRPTEYVTITAKTKDGEFSAKYVLKISNNNGYLTREKLDSMDLSSVNKLMIVAHPDDETLWGGAHLVSDDYFVVVLTNGFYQQRADDFNAVMNSTGDKHIILSYPDTRRNYTENGKSKYETDEWSTARKGMMKDIELLLNYKQWDTIVTHNPDGEYNKYHHIKTSEYVTECRKTSINSGTPLYYFGHYYGAGAQIPGEQLGEAEASTKRELVNMYLPIAKGAVAAFGHMIPYENWIPADEW